MSTEGDEIQAKTSSLLGMKPLKDSSGWRESEEEEETDVQDRWNNLAGGVHVKREQSSSYLGYQGRS